MIQDLLQRWHGQPRCVILDSDFGDGARFLSALQAWQDHPRRPVILHYLAMSPQPVAIAALPQELRAQWPPFVPGFHRMALRQGRVILDLLIGDAEASLVQIDASLDAAWLPAPLRSSTVLARLMSPGASLHAAQLDDAQRLALIKAGFVFGADGLSAVFHSRRPPAVRPALERRAIERRAIVIGAGLSGAAACERLCARGWDVTLIERHGQPAQEASGNLAGIFMPVLSKDDNPATRLSRAAYLFALRHWRNLGNGFEGQQCGVLQLARDARHAEVQRQIAASGAYPRDFARWLDAAEAGALLGAPAPHGGWLFGQGGWAYPASVCRMMLDACGPRLTRIFASGVAALEYGAGEWRALDADGRLIAQAPSVILANGNGAVRIQQAGSLPLSAVRGQVTHLAEGSLPAPPLVVCREAYLTPAAHGVVCAGATYDLDHERALRTSSQQENLHKIAAILDIAAPDAPLAGRVGFRCVATDRLPLAGALPNPAIAGRCERLRDVPRWPGLFGLLGYASRGLIWAPLAAELLAAQLEGEPLPLESSLAAALDPGRFLLKERRRHGP
ncbi:FAD-dependent 5-carboxymethylaminomethyl-2-thiouridine(34) oxidoreductase MnmC [Janthinobacterium agaricidamnosum]|uniref:tRNA U-34 5-methylaminomethyl-2-thiouridine biosynthesis protein MnmC, C-terminal domain n=1 Tax=Janthinobacterium agaricidamnosum NBRC 102515 = DSM 9628 TaxID=1349767 RepID=W0V998_9BURK|nr:FAD-dependent 5-carboxymethylaminomethyl-2-thiouridine(34) oxidoreductase MnmC [Janthinobacterium agaricidamnosum]CDG85404.1 tRNA U-34 5-methylaminomethyl-2-thiouridine biosynthesis protein MnmC, C-terminal domain [Janthinobacterium agaricidamnosum NBRC 102515 = DSM 9628]